MALKQVTVPWIRGYDVGIGADFASGSPMGQAVTGAATPVDDARGAVVNMSLQRIHTTEELESALGIDAEASYGSAAFGAGISARFNFAKSSKVQSSSLFMSVNIQVELEFLSIDDPMLTDHAVEAVGRPDVFVARYGNAFVRGVGRGGLFVGVLRIDTGSSQETTEVAAALDGAYGLFSAEAETRFREVQTTYRNEVFVAMYHEGGPIDLTITDPTNPLELLTNANLFLQSFQTDPAAVARPYFVTIAPMVVARGPLPPNSADIDHAQDVIVYCAKRRSALLDQLNLLDYILDNPTKYSYDNGARAEELRDASRELQEDLDLLAACASAAMNNPVGCLMPAEFAEARGTTFPKAELPSLLPDSVAGNVRVPDFRSCSTWAACVELAQSAGLGLGYEYQGTAPEAFRVIDFRPPKDAEVPPGTVVTVVCPPDPPRDWAKLVRVNPDNVWTHRLER